MERGRDIHGLHPETCPKIVDAMGGDCPIMRSSLCSPPSLFIHHYHASLQLGTNLTRFTGALPHDPQAQRERGPDGRLARPAADKGGADEAV